MNGSRNDGTPLVQEETGGKTGVRICANASHRDFSCLAGISIYVVRPIRALSNRIV